MPADDDLRDVLAAVSYYVGRPRSARPTDVPPLYRPAPAGEAPYRAWTLRAVGTGARAAELRRLGRSLRQRAEEHGITLLIRGDQGWPTQTGINALPCLWVRGDPDVAALLGKAVTITGGISCTDDGRQVAAELAGPLAAEGLTIATGLSAGIDAAAAAAAFDTGVAPVLLSPAGLDQPAGRALRKLADRAVNRGTLISPFPPGRAPTNSRMAFRDALLGTLGAATVLVEVSATSRALRAAWAAHDAGWLVLAVPGSVTTGTWAGCHQLIADRTAQLVTSASTVLEAVRMAADRGNLSAAAAVAALDEPDSRRSIVRTRYPVAQQARQEGR
ncbi:DNA-processing protein DprA [Actinoplanes sp. ATCC 53533]|uniref:DNA-processing protein DprA n=1 Tax=Actinoplanes sp. ATCC 53533 TaxID=1288362 RepID=UPI00131530B4|nr:DNA-processing protein DprA [Actinoplanes sp. ATCC 53533]